MAELRISIKDGTREYIDDLKQKDILGFDSIDNTDVYLFFAALGNDSPIDFTSKDGYVRIDGDRNTDAKAKISSFLLGTFKSDDDLDKYADFKECIDYADKCAYSGFLKFKELYESTENEENLLKKLELNLNNLYSSLFD